MFIVGFKTPRVCNAVVVVVAREGGEGSAIIFSTIIEAPALKQTTPLFSCC